MEKEKVIIERWEKLGLLDGLLDGLNDDAKKIIAHAYEKLAKLIIYDNLNISKSVETLCFPIARAILFVDENYNKFTVESVQDLMSNMLYTLNDKYGEALETASLAPDLAKQYIGDIDYEGKFCYCFAMEYIKENIK